MESNGLHDLKKMKSQSLFSESSVMKRWVPYTLLHIKNGVPLCENGVQITFFSPLFLDTFIYIDALLNSLSTDK